MATQSAQPTLDQLDEHIQYFARTMGVSVQPPARINSAGKRRRFSTGLNLDYLRVYDELFRRAIGWVQEQGISQQPD